MAFAIKQVKIVPLAPTIVPTEIIKILFCTKPIVTDAHPESELRADITTGISAPLIGKIKAIPKSKAKKINI